MLVPITSRLILLKRGSRKKKKEVLKEPIGAGRRADLTASGNKRGDNMAFVAQREAGEEKTGGREGEGGQNRRLGGDTPPPGMTSPPCSTAARGKKNKKSTGELRHILLGGKTRRCQKVTFPRAAPRFPTGFPPDRREKKIVRMSNYVGITHRNKKKEKKIRHTHWDYIKKIVT